VSEKASVILKAVFSGNLKRYMDHQRMNTADLAAALSLPFSTVSDWVHGRKYPRMDKVQAIADLFGIMKSDLTEEPNCNDPKTAGEKEKPHAQSMELSERDIRLLKWFRSLPPEKQKAILISQDAPEGLAD